MLVVEIDLLHISFQAVKMNKLISLSIISLTYVVMIAYGFGAVPYGSPGAVGFGGGGGAYGQIWSILMFSEFDLPFHSCCLISVN